MLHRDILGRRQSREIHALVPRDEQTVVDGELFDLRGRQRKACLCRAHCQDLLKRGHECSLL